MTTTDGFETQSAPPAAPGPPAPKRTVGVRLDSGEAFAGIAGGFAFTAGTNAIAIAAGTPGSATLAERLAHHAFDAAETLGIGVLAGSLVGLWLRFVRAPRWLHLCAYAAVSSVAMSASLGQDLARQALVPFEGKLERPLYVLFVLLCGLAVPVAHGVGALFARRGRLRAAPLTLALFGVITNHLLLRDDYAALHGAIAWTSATLAGATLAPAFARAFRSTRSRAGLALAALLGVAVAPPNGVRLALFTQPGASAAWILASSYWSLPDVPAAAPPDVSSIPRSPPALVSDPPVVVLITIDATRADEILSDVNDALLPAIARLKRTGAVFSRATAPGSQTAVSLSGLFSGKYFSELHWSMFGVGEARFAYPALETTPRFPELLRDRGIPTSIFCGLNFLASGFGIARGFSDERMVAKGRGHALAKDLVDPLMQRLGSVGPDSAFLFAHLMEPHSPYDRGSVKSGSDRERYRSEIAAADAQIGRIADLLARRFERRGWLIVSADHGEAFGEHGTYEHSKTLYEELLRVPLLVKGPDMAPRRIDEPVSLVDVGPTVLEIFGVDSTGFGTGSSLVPLLRGERVSLARPIAAEGRLRRALYVPPNLKVIEDVRRKTVEVYDLSSDPQETRNLFDADRPRAERALALLRTFFAAHTLHEPGYSPVYKP